MGKRAGSDGGMGHFGRVASLKDLPPDRHFIEYVRKAADLKPKSARRELTIPKYFRTALRRNKKAAVTFNGFSYTNKKEYLEWITEAKREETRSKRLQTAIAWMAQGKPRNWKYLQR